MSLTEPTYYTADADTWCEDCVTRRYGASEGVCDSEGNEIGAAFGDESDSPVHCAGCGAFMENALTPEGYAYILESVIEALGHGRQSVAVTEWAPYYGLPDSLDPDPYADRFDVVRGAYWACADYHAGQWSRGYRHLSKLSRHYRPGPLESSARLEGDALAAYVRVAVSMLNRP